MDRRFTLETPVVGDLDQGALVPSAIETTVGSVLLYLYVRWTFDCSCIGPPYLTSRRLPSVHGFGKEAFRVTGRNIVPDQYLLV